MDNEIKKDKNNRRKAIKIRLNDELYDYLHDLKKMQKCKDWESLVIKLLNEKRGVKKVLVDENGHALKYLNALQKCGTNLNQIAKIANQNKKIDDKGFEEFQKLSHQIKKARAYFCQKVIPNFDRKK